MDEFLKEYSNELRQRLQRNDKAAINTLSMLAEAQKECAEGIVGVIEKHILTCPPPAKLPALYLVDSILKNVREPYVSLFERRIAEVFGAVWDITLQERRASLSKLYATWDTVFPTAVLAQVASRMVSTSNGRQQVPPAQQQTVLQSLQHLQQQQQPVIQHAVQTQYGLAGAPGMQLHAQHQQPYLAVQQPYAAIQQPSVGLTYVQLPSGQLVQVAVPQPAPPQHMLMQHSTPAFQQHSSPTYQNHSTPTYQHHKTPQHVMQVQGSHLPPVSPGHGSLLQQQQQQQPAAAGPGPMVRRSPSSPGTAVLESARGPPPPPARNRRTPSPGPNSGDLAGDALSQLLSSLASRGVLAQKDKEAEALKTTEFQSSFIKELHPGVLEELQQLSIKSAPRFRDVEFQRNKRKAATAGSAVSRSWYLPVDTWIAGTTAPEEALAANPFDDEDASGSDVEEDEAVEPEDPDQTMCAISGEPFDKFFNQDQEGWFYRGVVRITGDEADRYGVPDGSLVKVKCLAEAGLGTGTAAMAAAGAAAGLDDVEQQQEAMMAAAAAEAPAAGVAHSTAAAGSGEQQGDVGEDQTMSHAAVQQEPSLDAADSKGMKVDGLVDTATPASSAADLGQHVGSKRDGSSEAVDEDTPAKRVKVEQ